MRTQRNIFQTKEQNKTPEKKLNEMETSNMPDKEFKTMILKMLNELERIDELIESFNKEIENIKKEPIRTEYNY